jgi:hypothetical protein
MSFRKASREILRLIAIVPEASTACTWKYRFAISMPITLTSILTSSLWFKGLRQPEPEPEPEREGRPSHHVGVAGRQPNPGAARGRNHRRRLPSREPSPAPRLSKHRLIRISASVRPQQTRSRRRQQPPARTCSCFRCDRHRIEHRENLRPLTELLTPPEQLAGVDPGCARNFRCDRARLHGRRNDPFLLSSRPMSAPLHRRDHLNLRLGHRTSPRISTMT